MKRTTKRYVITTSGLNCYLFRVLTDGIDFSQYLNNPVLLWMHQRATGDKNGLLPLGRAVELKKEGDKLTCLGVSEICYTLFRGKTDHLFAGKEMQLMR